MDYIDVAAARDLAGLRLVLTAHVPGPWSEAAKKTFEYKNIPYIPVAQYAGRENAALVAWTGSRNAPIAMYGNEPPRTGWYDILMLAERLAPDRPLLPEDPADRAVCVGISNELLGEWGFGWARRAMMGTAHAGTPDPVRLAGISAPPFTDDEIERMRSSYSVSVGAAADAPARCAAILRMLAARLHRQRETGSSYLVGRHISACDIHWAVFSMALEPLPHAVNPMPDWMRLMYDMVGPVIAAASDPILIEHRDYIYASGLSLPLDF